MRALIYDPYLDTLGGGERYIATVATTLKSQGFIVYIPWMNPKILENLEQRFNLDLSGIEIIENIPQGGGYDIAFWLSDGSIPNLSARKNILHFQTPFQNVSGESLFNRLKLRKIQKVVCNSKFTKSFIDPEYGVEKKSVVVYPPVDITNIKPGKKENIILSVGRFSQLQQSKHQDILIDEFIKARQGGLKGWKLVLIGASDVGGLEFANKLKEIIKNQPIEVLENLPFQKVRDYYAKAKIFWSASGYGENEEENPQKVEHFGITVVEAMAAGAVPVVTGKGGHKETVKDTVNGFLWDSVTDLVKITKKLVEQPKVLEKVSKNAAKHAKKFSESRFEKEILQVFI